MRRKWIMGGWNGYWFVTEKDPDGTGTTGDRIYLSSRKAALAVAKSMNDAYAAGWTDAMSTAFTESK